MRVTNLTQMSRTYTCNVYLVRGDWNRPEDLNTLVDVGRDPSLIETLKGVSTGLGKKRVQQVVLTHDHYDHTGMLQAVRSAFKPLIYAFSPFLKGSDKTLRSGDIIKMGDKTFEVIHTPGHSQDSICLFCQEDGTLFSGDTPMQVRDANGDYEETFVQALEVLAEKNVKTIYPGHGPAIVHKPRALLKSSLRTVKQARTSTEKGPAISGGQAIDRL